MPGTLSGFVVGLLWVLLLAAQSLAVIGRRRKASPAEPDLESVPILVFDTETADLPRDFLAPASDLTNWPRLVQIAWMECDPRFRVRRAERYIVSPDGFQIAPSAARVHGITTQYALEHGMPLRDVLERFAARLGQAGMVVAHNVDFDEKVVTAESIRAGVPCRFGDLPSFCSMKGTTQVCKLPSLRLGVYRWPTLEELHETVLESRHETAHDALRDVEAVVRCLRTLVDNGTLKIRKARRASGDPDAAGRRVVYRAKVAARP